MAVLRSRRPASATRTAQSQSQHGTTPDGALQRAGVADNSDDNTSRESVTIDAEPSGASSRRVWTAEEDQKLVEAIQKYGSARGPGSAWGTVSALVGGARTNKDCRKRWFHSLDPSLRKGKWTEEEDRKLRQLYAELGPQWKEIALRIPGRKDDQVSKRWRDVLCPELTPKEPWTALEDALLLQLHQSLGPKWTVIAEHLPGRSPISCRNRTRRFSVVVARVARQRLSDSNSDSSSPQTSIDRSETAANEPDSESRSSPRGPPSTGHAVEQILPQAETPWMEQLRRLGVHSAVSGQIGTAGMGEGAGLLDIDPAHMISDMNAWFMALQTPEIAAAPPDSTNTINMAPERDKSTGATLTVAAEPLPLAHSQGSGGADMACSTGQPPSGNGMDSLGHPVYIAPPRSEQPLLSSYAMPQVSVDNANIFASFGTAPSSTSIQPSITSVPAGASQFEAQSAKSGAMVNNIWSLLLALESGTESVTVKSTLLRDLVRDASKYSS